MSKKLTSLLFRVDRWDPLGKTATDSMLIALHAANQRHADRVMRSGVLDKVNDFCTKHNIPFTLHGSIPTVMCLPPSSADFVLYFRDQSVNEIVSEFRLETKAVVDTGVPKYCNVIKLSINGEQCNLMCVQISGIEEWVNEGTYTFSYPPVQFGETKGLSFVPDSFNQLQQMSIDVKSSDNAYAAFFLAKMALPELSTGIIIWLAASADGRNPFWIMQNMFLTMKSAKSAGLNESDLKEIEKAIPVFTTFLQKNSLIDQAGKAIYVSVNRPVSKRMCSICTNLAELLSLDVTSDEFVGRASAILA